MKYLKKYLKLNSYVENTVKINSKAYIGPNNTILGKTEIGENTCIIEGNYIVDSIISKNCEILKSVIEKSNIGNNVNIGPYSHLRPQTKICDNVKIGNYCEIKKSVIGEKTKIAHLTYVGDAEIGKNCNIGCGVIFCNYNGKEKNKSHIKDNVFVGSNVNLIAPLTIEENTFIAAGTTVTKSVDKNKFIIGRVKQEVKENKNLI